MKPSRLSATAVLLIAICAIGMAPRAAKVVFPNPEPGDDAHAYYALATSLYEDGTFGGPDFNNASDWSPGAPLLYAGLFYLTGEPREGTIRILQALMGLGTMLIVFALGRRLARGVVSGPLVARAETAGATRPRALLGEPARIDRADAVGLIGALAVALYPPYIHATGATMSEPLGTLLLPSVILGMLWAYDRGGGPFVWALPGLLAGLLAMARPEYLIVGFALALFAAIIRARSAAGSLARAKRLGATGAVFLLAMAVPILPWTIHNLSTLDRLVPISTGSGKALYVGTYLPGDGDYQQTKAILARQQLGVELEPSSPELNAVEPRPLFDTIAERYPDLPRDSALGQVGRDQLEHYLTGQPLDYAAMTVRKVWRMWSRGQGGLMDQTLARAAQVAIVIAGLVGIAILARRRRLLEATLVALPVLAITAVGAVTLASERRGQILFALVFPLAALALAVAQRRAPPYPEPE